MFKNVVNSSAPFALFPTLSWFITFSGVSQTTYISSQLPSPFRGNRLILPGPNQIRTFSIPVQKVSHVKDVQGLRSSVQSKWNKELMHALQTTYGKSAYFDHYEPFLAQLFASPDVYLWDLAKELGRWYNQVLQWDSPWELTSDPAAQLPQKPFKNEPYFQVFSDLLGFVYNAPILDLICNVGPESGLYLERHIQAIRGFAS